MSSSTCFVSTSDSATRIRRFEEVRDASSAIAAPLSPEDCAVQTMPEVSPTKWHLAHTTWFFENFILDRDRGYRRYDESFCYLFNSYYEAVGERQPRPERGLLTRPGLDRVLEYRQHVDRAMRDLLDREDDRRTLAVVELGLQHEQQHQELMLTDIKHVFGSQPLLPVYEEAGPHPHMPKGSGAWLEQEGGICRIGHDGDWFAYDNESPSHEALLQPFAIHSRPVSNGQYLEFIEDGGYRRPELWQAEGWDRLREESWVAPLYWHRDSAGSWQEFTLRGKAALLPDAPACHLSWYEADAFARWAGARLPTEEEWEAVHGKLDHTGQVWEWTGSAYRPYPGYRAPEGALGEYNGKFMCNQFVLRGGSCASPKQHVRPTYRNFFHPHERWQFSGLRLARDL